jgi:DNA-binding response OmpR family regulator
MNESLLSGRNVLIVEDEFLIADDLAATIARHGGIVLGPVPNQAEAKKLIDRTPPDVAVLDINLQGDEAFPLADTLIERNVPVLFLSGYDRPHLPRRFDGVPLLQKPHEAGVVAEGLAALLRSAGTDAGE